MKKIYSKDEEIISKEVDIRAIGNKIKLAREMNELTQEDLAELTGFSTNHISVIETGKKAIKIDTFVKIANELNVSGNELLADVLKNKGLEDSESSITLEQFIEFVKNLDSDERELIIKMIRSIN